MLSRKVIGDVWVLYRLMFIQGFTKVKSVSLNSLFLYFSLLKHNSETIKVTIEDTTLVYPLNETNVIGWHDLETR